MKRTVKTLSISIEPGINKILEEGGYNKSKLINMLLKKHLKEQKDKK